MRYHRANSVSARSGNFWLVCSLNSSTHLSLPIMMGYINVGHELARLSMAKEICSSSFWRKYSFIGTIRTRTKTKYQSRKNGLSRHIEFSYILFKITWRICAPIHLFLIFTSVEKVVQGLSQPSSKACVLLKTYKLFGDIFFIVKITWVVLKQSDDVEILCDRWWLCLAKQLQPVLPN